MAGQSKTPKKPANGGQARRPRKTVNARRMLFIGWGCGLAMGLFVALMVHLEHTRPPETASATEGAESAEATASADEGPRFEFYRLLSEQEVEVAARETGRMENAGALPSVREQDGADEDTTEADPSEEDATAAPTGTEDRDSGDQYLLQAGSFRQSDDAEALRANLALLGIQARVQTVELPGGETWHRVRIGPYSSLDDVNTVRERMAGQEIDAILLRAGG